MVFVHYICTTCRLYSICVIYFFFRFTLLPHHSAVVLFILLVLLLCVVFSSLLLSTIYYMFFLSSSRYAVRLLPAYKLSKATREIPGFPQYLAQMENLLKGSIVTRTNPAMLGFVNEVKEAVQEYKPQLDIETMVLQNNIEIPSVKYDQAPSIFPQPQEQKQNG